MAKWKDLTGGKLIGVTPTPLPVSGYAASAQSGGFQKSPDGGGGGTPGGYGAAAGGSGIAPGTQEGVPTGGYYPVQSNGKAPVGLGVGDNVVTGGGTFQITGVNPDGTYQSARVSDVTTGSYTGPYGATVTRPDGVTQKAFDYKYDPTDYGAAMLNSQTQGEFAHNASGRVNQADAQGRDISGSGAERSNADIYRDWWQSTGSQTPVQYQGNDGQLHTGYYGMDGSGNWGYYDDAGLTQKSASGNWDTYKASDGGYAHFTTDKGYLWPDTTTDPSRAGQTVTLVAGNKAFNVTYGSFGQVEKVVNLTATRGVDGRTLDLPTARAYSDQGVNGPELLRQSNGVDYAGYGSGVNQNELRGATRNDYDMLTQGAPRTRFVYGTDPSTGNIYGYPSGADLNTMTWNGEPFEPVIYDRGGNLISAGSFGTGGDTGGGARGTQPNIGGYSGGYGAETGGAWTGGTGGYTGGTTYPITQTPATVPTPAATPAATTTPAPATTSTPAATQGEAPAGAEQGGTWNGGSLEEELRALYEGNDSAYMQALAELRAANEAAVERATNTLESQKRSANLSYADLFRQLYIDRMNNQRGIDQRMAAQGVTGGAAESTLLGLGTQYEDALRQGEQARLNTLYGLDQAIADARLSGDISAAEQAASLARENVNSYADALRSLIAQRNADRAYNYQLGRDTVSDWQWQQQYALQAQQAAASASAAQTRAAASAASAAASQQLAAEKWAYQQEQDALKWNYGLQQDAYAQQVALAKLAAQYGDYSGLNALGIDTASYAAQQAAAQQGQSAYSDLPSYPSSYPSAYSTQTAQSAYKPQFTIAQVNSAIRNNTMTQAVKDAYEYYYGVPYGSAGTAAYMGYSAGGAAYPVGSTRGINFITDAKSYPPGSSMTGGDGSVWVKNADGSVTITKGGVVYTVR